MIVSPGAIYCIACLLATVVLSERTPIVFERRNHVETADRLRFSLDLGHQLIDVLQFLERGPIGIFATPARTWL